MVSIGRSCLVVSFCLIDLALFLTVLMKGCSGSRNKDIFNDNKKDSECLDAEESVFDKVDKT